MIAEDSRSTAMRVSAFAETQWSMVIHARASGAELARDALEELCRTYWVPLYRFVRRCGHGASDAQDLTQSFFEHLTESDALQKVDRSKGKFRSFLLVCLKNFLANERAKAQTLRRGSRIQFLQLDGDDPERRFTFEPHHDAPPDTVFDHAWAITIVSNALGELKQEYANTGKAGLFEVLQAYLSGERDGETYAMVAASLSMSEPAVKMAVVRLRRRFGQFLRAQLAQALSGPDELDDELRYLLSALAR